MHLNTFVFCFKLFAHLCLIFVFQYLYRVSTIKKLAAFTSTRSPKLTSVTPLSSSQHSEQNKERVPSLKNDFTNRAAYYRVQKIRGRKTKDIPLQTTW